MDADKYIDHEVRIRIQEETSKRLDNKTNLIIGIAITSVVIPIVLHVLGLK